MDQLIIKEPCLLLIQEVSFRNGEEKKIDFHQSIAIFMAYSHSFIIYARGLQTFLLNERTIKC